MTGHAIRPCEERDIEIIYEIINDAAQAYRGIIPVSYTHLTLPTNREV